MGKMDDHPLPCCDDVGLERPVAFMVMHAVFCEFLCVNVYLCRVCAFFPPYTLFFFISMCSICRDSVGSEPEGHMFLTV